MPSTSGGREDDYKNDTISRHCVNDHGQHTIFITEPMNAISKYLYALYNQFRGAKPITPLCKPLQAYALPWSPISPPQEQLPPNLKVSKRASYLYLPITVGKLPLNPRCALSIWPRNRSSPLYFNSKKIACKASASKHFNANENRTAFETTKIRNIGASTSPQMAARATQT